MRFCLIILGTVLVAACSSAPKSEPEKSSESATTTKVTTSASETKASGKTAASATTSAEKVMCSVKGDERTLDLRAKGSGCELGYTKGGQESIVATSQNGKAHCEATMTKIKERLTGSGFDCK
jgi:hypothetical protein